MPAILPVAVIIVLGYAAGVCGHTDGFETCVLNFSAPELLFFITASADLDTLPNGEDVMVFTIAIMRKSLRFRSVFTRFF